MAIRYLTQVKRWWKDPFRNRPNWSEKVTVLLTVVVVFIAVAQLRIYRQQKAIMESSSQQTDKLITAANIQACAASKFANSAAEINAQTAKAVGEFKRLADDSEGNIRAIRESSRQDQRAWVGVLASMPKVELNKPVTATAIGINSGKTFAVEVRIDSTLWFSAKKLSKDKDLPPIQPTPLEEYSLGLLIPNIRLEARATPHTPDGKPREAKEQDITRLTDQGWYTYIYGAVRYDDVFKKHHTTEFCWYRTGVEGDFSQREMHNSAN